MVNTALFDFDGVVADTEPEYDKFWNSKSQEFGLGLDNFAAMIKGKTLRNILEEYFPDATDEQKSALSGDIDKLELEMPYPQIPGAVDFIRTLKKYGFKLGLVTSSPMRKMRSALPKLNLSDAFDAIATSDFVKEGKPNPQCYLTAAQMLKSEPSECAVFEDSINGMAAALNAKMHLFGMATTLPENKIYRYTSAIFPDFLNREKILEKLQEAIS